MGDPIGWVRVQGEGRARTWVAAADDKDAVALVGMARDIEIDQRSQRLVLLVPIERPRFVGVAVVPVPRLAVRLRRRRRSHRHLSLSHGHGIFTVGLFFNPRLVCFLGLSLMRSRVMLWLHMRIHVISLKQLPEIATCPRVKVWNGQWHYTWLWPLMLITHERVLTFAYENIFY